MGTEARCNQTEPESSSDEVPDGDGGQMQSGAIRRDQTQIDECDGS